MLADMGANVHLAHPLGNNWGNRRVTGPTGRSSPGPRTDSQRFPADGADDGRHRPGHCCEPPHRRLFHLLRPPAGPVDGWARRRVDHSAPPSDSHQLAGQSEIGFGITRLLGFAAEDQADQQGQAVPPRRRRARRLPEVGPALTRPIRWDFISQQYDQRIKYTTAIRVGTASTKAILRRFTTTSTPPTRPCSRSARPQVAGDEDRLLRSAGPLGPPGLSGVDPARDRCRCRHREHCPPD